MVGKSPRSRWTTCLHRIPCCVLMGGFRDNSVGWELENRFWLNHYDNKLMLLWPLSDRIGSGHTKWLWPIVFQQYLTFQSNLNVLLGHSSSPLPDVPSLILPAPLDTSCSTLYVNGCIFPISFSSCASVYAPVSRPSFSCTAFARSMTALQVPRGPRFWRN